MSDRGTSSLQPGGPQARKHSWVAVASGRVCTECMKTQATNEFDDSPDCPGSRRPV